MILATANRYLKVEEDPRIGDFRVVADEPGNRVWFVAAPGHGRIARAFAFGLRDVRDRLPAGCPEAGERTHEGALRRTRIDRRGSGSGRCAA